MENLEKEETVEDDEINLNDEIVKNEKEIIPNKKTLNDLDQDIQIENLEKEEHMKDDEINLNDEIEKNEKEIISTKKTLDDLDQDMQIRTRNIINEINRIKRNEKIESIKIESEKIDENDFLQLNSENKTEKHVENVGLSLNGEVAKHAKEIELIKERLNDLDQEMNIRMRNIWREIDEINSKLINSEVIDENETFQLNSENKVEKIESRIEKEIQTTIDDSELEQKKVDNSKIQMKIEPKINLMGKYVEDRMNENFEFLICDVDDLMKRGRIWSEFYYATMLRYKLRFKIWCSFNGDDDDDKFGIYLCIYDDAINQDLPFPFKADVTMNIFNKNRQEIFSSITKYCQIDKPRNKSYKASDSFFVLCSELRKNGIFESNCFTIQCCVELESFI